MKRISPSALTGLFSELPPSGKRSAPLNMTFLGPVFARGHVFEHEALHHLKNLVHNVQGQNAFARFFEYLESDIVRYYTESAWMLEHQSENFRKNLIQRLRNNLLSEDDASMARQEKSVYLLEEQDFAIRMIESLNTQLSKIIQPCLHYDMFNARRSEWSYDDYKRLSTVREIPVLIQMIHVTECILRHESDYTIQGIEYLLPRYTIQEGDSTVVCIPDGLCEFNGKRTVIEIKCPVAQHYSMAKYKLWLKYFIQIAIEINVTNSEQAIFMCWFNKRAKYIVVTKYFLENLTLAVFSFIKALAVGKKTRRIDEAYANVPKTTVLDVVRELYTILEVLKKNTVWKDALHDPISNRQIRAYRKNVKEAVDTKVEQVKTRMLKSFRFSCRFEVPNGKQGGILTELNTLLSGDLSDAVRNMLQTAADKIVKNLPVATATSDSDKNKLTGSMFKMFTYES